MSDNIPPLAAAAAVLIINGDVVDPRKKLDEVFDTDSGSPNDRVTKE
jgi:hypothetical protein